MSNLPEFKPLPLTSGCHRQTIISSFVNFCRAPFSKTQYVHLPDHDWLAMEVTTPPTWKKTDLTVVMVHGLCGSHKSPYMVRMARKLAAKGVKVVRVNMRGCGSGKGLARRIYRAGCSDDILCAFKEIKKAAPESPTILMGFSLGGNVVLKLTGELAENAPQYYQRVIAVSPPADLVSGIHRIESPKNRIYERYFMRLLVEDVLYRHKHFPELPEIELSKELKALDFDSIYMAPLFGYHNVFDYYRNNQAINVIQNIAIPTTVLFAEDDPIIDAHMFDHITLPETVSVHTTSRGGHLGYLGAPNSEGGVHWLDHFLMTLIFND